MFETHLLLIHHLYRLRTLGIDERSDSLVTVLSNLLSSGLGDLIGIVINRSPE